MRIKKCSKNQHKIAAHIVTNVMKIIELDGRCDEVERFGMVIRWAGDGVSIMVRPPFLGGGLRYPKTQMSIFGIDIWDETKGKVLNLEFDLNNEIVLVSFKRGEWERKIENIAQILQANHLGSVH